jgi:hypothetical protein
MDLQAFVFLAVAEAVDNDFAIDATCEHIDPVHDGESDEVQCVLVAYAVTG